MAELSRLFGIIIRMFAEHGGKHHTPHFHAGYQEHEAVYTIDPVHLLSGSLPIKRQRMVERGQKSIYTLRIRFHDDSEQTINFEPILRGEIYGPLRDLDLFNQVRLDPEVRTLIWPNDADLDPADLHDWPEIEQGFIEHSMLWETS